MEYIVLSKYRHDRWKQLLEAVLDLDQDPEQLIHEMTGITVGSSLNLTTIPATHE